MNESKIRVAVYTRKSLEEGLEQEFNSLEVQREAVENYVASQKANGLVVIPKHYDDGGFTGANINRPALQELISDIDCGKIDMVAVYKIDRLSRSLMDFAELFRHFEECNVKFVSVTQQIDTSTPAGRMTLNILMTFAQFEREMTSDRIRDKVHASIKKGIWIGGTVPFGYKIDNHKLIIEPDGAALVRQIYNMYVKLGDTGVVASELRRAGEIQKNGLPWTGARVWGIIRNPIYKGYMLLKGKEYRGEHHALVSEEVWTQANDLYVQKHSGKASQRGRGRKSLAPLMGILKCGHCGGSMTPSNTVRRGVRYNYYVCTNTVKGRKNCPKARISAPQVEEAVFAQVIEMLKTPSVIQRLADKLNITRERARVCLSNMTDLWDALFPLEKQRLIRELVDHVVFYENSIDISLKLSGAKNIIDEMEENNALGV